MSLELIVVRAIALIPFAHLVFERRERPLLAPLLRNRELALGLGLVLEWLLDAGAMGRVGV